MDTKSFIGNQLVGLHLPLLFFSLAWVHSSVGEPFRNVIKQEPLDLPPAVQPLPNSMAHYAFFVKELVYYACSSYGHLGYVFRILLGEFGRSQHPGVVLATMTWLAMLPDRLGSFLASSLWMRAFTMLDQSSSRAFELVVGIGFIDMICLWGLVRRTSTVDRLCVFVGWFTRLVSADRFSILTKVIEQLICLSRSIADWYLVVVKYASSSPKNSLTYDARSVEE